MDSNAAADHSNSTEKSCRTPPIDSPAENETTETSDGKSVFHRIRNCFLEHKLEIFTFIFTFSYVLPNVTSTAMIVEKVCSVHFRYNSSVCGDLEEYQDIKDRVVQVATQYQLGHTLLQTAPATLLACFVGPWSDHYGRKLPILVGLVGMFLDAIGSSVCAYLLHSRAEYYLIPGLFTGLSGGSVTIMAVVYSYCSESSTNFGRTMKYAFVEMSVGFATSFGLSAGGWIFKGLGSAPVFLIAALGSALSFLFAEFLLTETRDNQDPWSVRMRELFSCTLFREGFAAMTKRRPNQGRKQIVLLIVSLCFLVIAMKSTGDISYLFAHHEFGWDNPTYSNFQSIYSVAGIVVLVVLIPLMVHFRMGDPCLGLLGTIALFGKTLGMGLCSHRVGLYHAANVIGFLGGVATFAARSRISKVAHADEIGKMFTFVAAAESLLPVLASVAVSQLFAACLQFFSGMPYIALSIPLVLPLGVFSWMLCLPKKSYEQASQTSETEEQAIRQGRAAAALPMGSPS